LHHPQGPSNESRPSTNRRRGWYQAFGTLRIATLNPESAHHDPTTKPVCWGQVTTLTKHISPVAQITPGGSLHFYHASRFRSRQKATGSSVESDHTILNRACKRNYPRAAAEVRKAPVLTAEPDSSAYNLPPTGAWSCS
jgi:hypothetical protein